MYNKKTFNTILLVAITTTLMGQVYINPFNSPFRLSMGIAILIFLILKFDDIPIIPVNICTAFTVFTLRFLIDFFQAYKTSNMDVGYIALKHFPSAIFYIIFGLALYQLKIREYKSQPIFFVFLASIADIISNVGEALVRQEFTKTSIEVILTSIFIVGFTRATIALMLFQSIKSYNMLILKQEHEKRYVNLILFTANMRAEIFFLKKTMQDIEQAMERCYSIYAELNEYSRESKFTHRFKERILNLSKDIHEIKKDNQRVVSGIEALLPEVEKDNKIKISNILKILKDNTRRYIESTEKDIKLLFEVSKDIKIRDYYPLITILDNLIGNAIDAIDMNGFIRVINFVKDDYIVFRVIDNGVGIKEEDTEVIFEPGFSTKFDRKTGSMSTGIGLTHVKHIINNHYKGDIEVESHVGVGTKFTIYMPIRCIIKEEEN